MGDKIELNKKSEKGTHYYSPPHQTSGKSIMSSLLDSEPNYEENFFQQSLPQYYRAVLKDFRKITHSFISFNLIYLSLFTVQVTLFFTFLPFLSKSSLFAVSLISLFLTCFSYFVLLFYFQAKKPEQIVELKERFLISCRQIITIPKGEAQHHLSLAEALSKLAAYLHDYEKNFYQVPKIFTPLANLICSFSTRCYKEDVYQMKLNLLQAAVDEHLMQIRVTPTDLEVHASLAATYVSLSKLYQNNDDEENFRGCAKLAIEEFSILNQYAPNDPWVHEQLALGYKELGMPLDELREVETLLKLRAQDREILFRLGNLYFKQGLNAKGLRVYEELKKANYKKAEDLIRSYGSFS